MGVIGSPDGLREIILPQESKEDVLGKIKSEQNLMIDTNLAAFRDLPQRLRSYLNGEKMNFPYQLDLDGATHFQQSVWQIVQTILYGETRSYAWVASQLGYDKASRAAGQAVGKNPLPIIIPCHRVICSDGSLGGFAGGLDIKRYLLHLEAARK
jgi:methylated-DNA-[protein]-cysteine S-methyltransferase